MWISIQFTAFGRFSESAGAFLLMFIMAWGASARTGIVVGLYDADAIDQYEWPPERTAIFAPFGFLIVGVALHALWQALHNPRIGLPSHTQGTRISAYLVDLMTFTGVVGAISIWPANIGVLYAVFLGLALFAFNRLNRRFDSVDALPLQVG